MDDEKIFHLLKEAQTWRDLFSIPERSDPFVKLEETFRKNITSHKRTGFEIQIKAFIRGAVKKKEYMAISNYLYYYTDTYLYDAVYITPRFPTASKEVGILAITSPCNRVVECPAGTLFEISGKLLHLKNIPSSDYFKMPDIDIPIVLSSCEKIFEIDRYESFIEKWEPDFMNEKMIIEMVEDVFNPERGENRESLRYALLISLFSTPIIKKDVARERGGTTYVPSATSWKPSSKLIKDYGKIIREIHSPYFMTKANFGKEGSQFKKLNIKRYKSDYILYSPQTDMENVRKNYPVNELNNLGHIHIFSDLMRIKKQIRINISNLYANPIDSPYRFVDLNPILYYAGQINPDVKTFKKYFKNELYTDRRAPTLIDLFVLRKSLKNPVVDSSNPYIEKKELALKRRLVDEEYPPLNLLAVQNYITPSLSLKKIGFSIMRFENISLEEAFDKAEKVIYNNFMEIADDIFHKDVWSDKDYRVDAYVALNHLESSPETKYIFNLKKCIALLQSPFTKEQLIEICENRNCRLKPKRIEFILENLRHGEGRVLGIKEDRIGLYSSIYENRFTKE